MNVKTKQFWKIFFICTIIGFVPFISGYFTRYFTAKQSVEQTNKDKLIIERLGKSIADLQETNSIIREENKQLAIGLARADREGKEIKSIIDNLTKKNNDLVDALEKYQSALTKNRNILATGRVSIDRAIKIGRAIREENNRTE